MLYCMEKPKLHMYWILVVAGQFISKVSNWTNPQAGVHGLSKALGICSFVWLHFSRRRGRQSLALCYWVAAGWLERKLTRDAQAVCNSMLLRSYTGYSNPWNNSNENTPPSPRKNLKIALGTRMEGKRISENSLLFVAFLKLRSHCLSGAVEDHGPQAPWICAKWFCRIQYEGCPAPLLC